MAFNAKLTRLANVLAIQPDLVYGSYYLSTYSKYPFAMRDGYIAYGEDAEVPGEGFSYMSKNAKSKD